MRITKIINILLCLIAIFCVWKTEGATDSKIFATGFFTVIIMFWLSANSPKINKENSLYEGTGHD